MHAEAGGESHLPGSASEPAFTADEAPDETAFLFDEIIQQSTFGK